MGKIERIIEEAEAINAKKLNLGDMGLKEAPADLKRLEKLELLTLSNNKIKSLPATFFTGLPRLESLNLFNNGLKEIPANINTLSHLRTLLASYVFLALSCAISYAVPQCKQHQGDPPRVW